MIYGFTSFIKFSLHGTNSTLTLKTAATLRDPFARGVSWCHWSYSWQSGKSLKFIVIFPTYRRDKVTS